MRTALIQGASRGLAELADRFGERLRPIPMDVADEASIERAAEDLAAWTSCLHLVVNAAGVLYDATGLAPEKKLADVDPASLQRCFAVNASGPLLVAVHPGTLDTELLRPFQRGVAPERLFSPERAARQLLGVLDRLTSADSGSFLAWDGSPIPW